MSENKITENIRITAQNVGENKINCTFGIATFFKEEPSK